MNEERLSSLRHCRDVVRNQTPPGGGSGVLLALADAVDEIESLRRALEKMIEVEDPGGFIFACHEEDGCHDALNARQFGMHSLQCPVRIAWDALHPEAK